MKSLKQLNEKVWYRFLKVIYIFFFSLVTIGVVLAVFGSYSPKKIIDENSTSIKCNNGRQFNPRANNIFLYNNSVPSYEENKINSLCGYDLTKDPLKILNNYQLNVVYKTVGSWVKAISYSIMSLILIYFSFEILRRTFYYIVLGIFNPKN